MKICKLLVQTPIKRSLVTNTDLLRLAGLHHRLVVAKQGRSTLLVADIEKQINQFDKVLHETSRQSA